MLIIDLRTTHHEWTAAGITLELEPLTEDFDQLFIEKTTERISNDAGHIVDVKKDVQRYAELVGNHCIKSWTGVSDEHGESVPANEGNINRFMRISLAQQFVFSKIKLLQNHLAEEDAAAKKE